jgi:hypothetical protein
VQMINGYDVSCDVCSSKWFNCRTGQAIRNKSANVSCTPPQTRGKLWSCPDFVDTKLSGTSIPALLQLKLFRT